jgi:hypothetical protein
MSGTAFKYAVLTLTLFSFVSACTTRKPVEPKKAEPAVIIKPKPPVLSSEQRLELGFPDELISSIETAASAQAEPFFKIVLVPAENLKGESEFEKEELTGFSVRTKNADDIIMSYRAGLRARGYLIFKSQRGYGSLPDIVSIVKGNNSYDLLKMQGTEAVSYNLDTKAIIVWLKKQQQIGSFVITGAGSDWVEARFIKQPRNLGVFAKKAAAFAPDIREYGQQTVDTLAERMKETNGFYLVWD